MKTEQDKLSLKKKDLMKETAESRAIQKLADALLTLYVGLIIYPIVTEVLKSVNDTTPKKKKLMRKFNK